MILNIWKNNIGGFSAFMLGWWNFGRHSGLGWDPVVVGGQHSPQIPKIRCPRGRTGSTPVLSTSIGSLPRFFLTMYNRRKPCSVYKLDGASSGRLCVNRLRRENASGTHIIESEVARRGTPLLRDVAVIRSGSGPALSASCLLCETLKRANRLKLKAHSVTLLRRLG